MFLMVPYFPVHNAWSIESILFFAEGTLLVREEKNGRREDPGLEEEKKKDDEKPPEKVVVPANTMALYLWNNRRYAAML